MSGGPQLNYALTNPFALIEATPPLVYNGHAMSPIRVGYTGQSNFDSGRPVRKEIVYGGTRTSNDGCLNA